MSTYTNNNQFEQPAIGSQAGTWGTTMNNDLAGIDQAIDGVVSIDISGLSSYTLTVPTGSGAGNGRNKLVIFYGTPVVTTNFPVTVSPNTAKKLYHIQAQGSFSVQVGQGSGNKYSIPQYCTAPVYCDGGGSGANVYNQYGGGTFAGMIVDSLVVDTGQANAWTGPVFQNSSGPGGTCTFGDGTHLYQVVLADNASIAASHSTYGVQIQVATTAPTTTNMPNGSMVFWIDQAGNNLKATVKYSTGTVKTFTGALA